MQQINFLPERIRRKRYSARQMRRNITMLVILAGLLVAFGAIGQMKISSARYKLDGYTLQLDSLSQRLAVVPQLQQQLADSRIKIQISEEVGSSVPVTYLLSEIARLLPEGACINEIDLSSLSTQVKVKGATAAAAKLSQGQMTQRVQLNLSGLAPTNIELAEFMATLSDSPIFEDIQMGYSRTVTIDSGRRQACDFTVLCTVTQ